MSNNVKISEVSDILRMQLEGIDTGVQFDEIGTVLQVSDGVVRIYGLRNAEANELLEFENGIKAIIQPGGSMRDEESVEAANEHGIPMMMTGMRHFLH